MEGSCGALQYTFYLMSNDTGALLPLPTFLNVTGDSSSSGPPFVFEVATDDPAFIGNHTFAVVVALADLPDTSAQFEILELEIREPVDLVAFGITFNETVSGSNVTANETESLTNDTSSENSLEALDFGDLLLTAEVANTSEYEVIIEYATANITDISAGGLVTITTNKPIVVASDWDTEELPVEIIDV